MLHYAIWNKDKQELIALNGISRIFGEKDEVFKMIMDLEKIFPHVELEIWEVNRIDTK